MYVCQLLSSPGHEWKLLIFKRGTSCTRSLHLNHKRSSLSLLYRHSQSVIISKSIIEQGHTSAGYVIRHVDQVRCVLAWWPSVETAWRGCRGGQAFASRGQDRHPWASERLGLSPGAWGTPFLANTDGSPGIFGTAKRVWAPTLRLGPL